MKQIFKSIAFGILLGTAAFFTPFIFKFILAFMVIGLIFSMFSGRRRHRHFAQQFEKFDHQYAPIVPIDNQWYKTNVSSGTVHHIHIND